jgi:RND family efflux transporter MFP subunit
MKTIATFLLLTFLTGIAVADESVIGVTEPEENIELTFPEAGVIRKIEVKEGDAISRDQLLAQLDSRVLESQLKIARMKAESSAAIQSANATLEMRRHRLEQLQKLAASQSANADELARAKAEYEIAQADLQLANEAAAEHALEAQQIEAQIEQRTLRSPFDGVVARIHESVGASVSPNQGTVIQLVRLEHLDLILHLDHRRLDTLSPGQVVKVEALDRPVTGEATVDFISPIIESSSGTVRVRLSLENQKGDHRSGVKYRVLLPGATVAEAGSNSES